MPPRRYDDATPDVAVRPVGVWIAIIVVRRAERGAECQAADEWPEASSMEMVAAVETMRTASEVPASEVATSEVATAEMTAAKVAAAEVAATTVGAGICGPNG
jgi:hypothetical protein